MIYAMGMYYGRAQVGSAGAEKTTKKLPIYWLLRMPAGYAPLKRGRFTPGTAKSAWIIAKTETNFFFFFLQKRG